MSSRNYFILRHRGARRPLAFATVASSFFCYFSTTTAQSVASSAFIPTNNVPSSATLRAYYSPNENKKPFITPPWHHQRLRKQQNVMSTSSLYDSTNNPSNDRERISNENIFFIQVGFGNDSHGQVIHCLFSHNTLRVKKMSTQQIKT